MQHSWIWLTLFAALLQAVRTAAQKRLAARLSTLAATYVRALFGLPFMVVYLVLLGVPEASGIASGGMIFFGTCIVAALTQNLGTAALLSLYRTRNFAVANQLARTNLVFTAVLGTLFFSEVIAFAGWIAIALTLAGAAVLSAEQTPAGSGGRGIAGLLSAIDGASLRTGLFVGAMFGLCNLMIREATQALGMASAIERGAVTVVTVTGLQVVMLGGWLAVREPGFLARIWNERRIALLVGLTSALGSIAWFAAFALTNASYVIAVGQVEAVFTVLISTFYFREKLTPMELGGIVAVIAGVLLFRLGA